MPTFELKIPNRSGVFCFIDPTLAKGDDKSSITTQFLNSVQYLKKPRTFSFDYALNA
jgi:hypothetical protein